jgi:outer membrane biogenesis lipoprotein LolB
MLKLGLVLFALCLLAGCSFQIGVEYTGRTAKDDRQFTPNKTPIKTENRY